MIPVRKIAAVTVFVFQKKETYFLVFLVRPADVENNFVQFPRCYSCLLFTMLSLLLMQILVSR